MSTDEPFTGACYPEPVNDNGERLIAAIRVDVTREPMRVHVAVRERHTSRLDYVFFDASRMEEIENLWHRRNS